MQILPIIQKASHEIAVNRIWRYIQRTKDKFLVFKLSKIMVVDFYVGADFSGL